MENLYDVGFNKSVPTRLAFDTIISKENADEIPDLHRYARKNNIFILLVNYLPSGRSEDPHTSMLDWNRQHVIYKELRAIDKNEFGLSAASQFPYG